MITPWSSSLECGSLVKPHPQTTLVNNASARAQHLQVIKAKATHMRVYCEVALRPHPFESLAIANRSTRPFRRRTRIERLLILRKLDPIECLQQPDEHERRLIVRELLAEANARAGVEGEEDERVWREVFVEPSVEEAVRIELGRYIQCRYVKS